MNKCYDLSTMGNDSEFCSALTQTELNKVGYSCARFNGSRYIRLPRRAMISKAMTVSFWAYMDDWTDFNNGMRLVSCTESGGWNFENSNGSIRCAIYDGNASAYTHTAAYSLSNISSGWHHFALVFDGSYARMYIDAVQCGISDQFSGAPNGRIGYNSSNRILIGAEPAASTTPVSSYFDGMIDDFKIFASALTQEELYKEYAVRLKIDDKNRVYCKWVTELPDNAENLIAYYGSADNLRTNIGVNCTIEQVRIEAKQGDKALKINTTSQDNYFTIAYAPLIGNHRYYGGLWVKNVDASRVQLYFIEAEPCLIGTSLIGTDWEYYSGVTTDAWVSMAKNYITDSQTVRVDIDATTSGSHSAYIDEVSLIDLTATYGGGLRVSVSSPNAVNTFSLRGCVANGATITNNSYTLPTTGEYTLSFTKSDSAMELLVVGFETPPSAGSGVVVTGALLELDISEWELGEYQFKVNVINHPTTSSTAEYTIIPLMDGIRKCKNLVDIATYPTTHTVTLYDEGVIPTKEELDRKFKGSGLSFSDDKGVVSIANLSEMGRPMRYIRVTMNGSNMNPAHHCVRLYADSVDSGRFALVDAFQQKFKGINVTPTYSNGSLPYYDVPTTTTYDIGSSQVIGSILMQRYYGDSRYYYQTKIEGSIDNTNWFTIWDSKNTGSYGNDNTYNTYVEDDYGKTFIVEADKVYMTDKGGIVVNEIVEE